MSSANSRVVNFGEIAESTLEPYKTAESSSAFRCFVVRSQTQCLFILYRALKAFRYDKAYKDQGLDIIFFPDWYKPSNANYVVTEETIAISVCKSTTSQKEVFSEIWNGKPGDCVRGPKDWELKILINDFFPTEGLKTGFHYTITSGKFELTVRGHGKHAKAWQGAINCEVNNLLHLKTEQTKSMNQATQDKLKQETKIIRSLRDLKDKPINTDMLNQVSTSIDPQCDPYKELFEGSISMHIENLDGLKNESTVNSANYPTLKLMNINCDSNGLNAVFKTGFKVIRDLIKLSCVVDLEEKMIQNEDFMKQMLKHYKEESEYFEQHGCTDYPISAVDGLKKLGTTGQPLADFFDTFSDLELAYSNYFANKTSIEPTTPTFEKEFKLFLERVRIANEKVWQSSLLFKKGKSENLIIGKCFKWQLRVLNVHLLQILFALLTRYNWDPNNIVSSFIEELLKDKRYNIGPKDEKPYMPFHKELQRLCGVLSETPDCQCPNLEWFYRQCVNAKLEKNWFTKLQRSVGTLLGQWRELSEKVGCDPSKLSDSQRQAIGLNKRDTEKILNRWFTRAPPLSIIEVELATTNGSISCYCWSGTEEKDNPFFYTLNDTHIPIILGSPVELVND
uniref:uncharacterized protein LOC100183618 n=1 Tax=Ciona intestinalis TaxID=7719 RepID=UPI000180CF8D|nr:uncharacterized protein LOC100183618 [Ciona intestinalis]|eukprot:XP_002126113.1 uncharacterized protein LOC100183618 [Ciona intestinalis]